MSRSSEDIGPPNGADGSHPAEAAIRASLLAALQWQIEAGVDETIEDLPIDRMSQAASLSKTADAHAENGQAKAQGGRKASKPKADEDAVDRAALEQNAREAAEGAQDLTALRTALENFEGSSLKTGAKHCVFSDGDPNANLMVIGEGPGKEEDQVGRPFVGRSGQLLDRMLAAIELDRKAQSQEKGVYIANLVPWRPLGNRTPDDQEVSILLPFLKRHIALAQPKLILCVGAPAAKHVMGAKTGITKFRGSWIQYDGAGAAIPCLSTLHPAYLLRSPDMKRFAWRDLLALRARMDQLAKESAK